MKCINFLCRLAKREKFWRLTSDRLKRTYHSRPSGSCSWCVVSTPKYCPSRTSKYATAVAANSVGEDERDSAIYNSNKTMAKSLSCATSTTGWPSRFTTRNLQTATRINAPTCLVRSLASDGPSLTALKWTPTSRPLSTTLVEFVFAMKEKLKLVCINENSFPLVLRYVGMNIGAVLAGVMGARKPQYDILSTKTISWPCMAESVQLWVWTSGSPAQSTTNLGRRSSSGQSAEVIVKVAVATEEARYKILEFSSVVGRIDGPTVDSSSATNFRLLPT